MSFFLKYYPHVILISLGIFVGYGSTYLTRTVPTSVVLITVCDHPVGALVTYNKGTPKYVVPKSQAEASALEDLAMKTPYKSMQLDLPVCTDNAI